MISKPLNNIKSIKPKEPRKKTVFNQQGEDDFVFTVTGEKNCKN